VNVLVTVTVCCPGDRLLYAFGLEQAPGLAPSSEHWNVAPVSSVLNVNDGLAPSANASVAAIPARTKTAMMAASLRNGIGPFEG
jgi:hypothetical protein